MFDFQASSMMSVFYLERLQVRLGRIIEHVERRRLQGSGASYQYMSLCRNPGSLDANQRLLMTTARQASIDTTSY